jgi:hypothetical protein
MKGSTAGCRNMRVCNQVNRCTVRDDVQGGRATLHCLCFSHMAHLHLNGFMNKENTSFWASENPQSCGDVTPSTKCTVWCAVCNQELMD